MNVMGSFLETQWCALTILTFVMMRGLTPIVNDMLIRYVRRLNVIKFG